eukprot:m.307180 g.307180  ORF g.307180 m.307180 type:complete len:284 (-) comp19627_c0_seq2:103-954(-)
MRTCVAAIGVTASNDCRQGTRASCRHSGQRSCRRDRPIGSGKTAPTMASPMTTKIALTMASSTALKMAPSQLKLLNLVLVLALLPQHACAVRYRVVLTIGDTPANMKFQQTSNLAAGIAGFSPNSFQTIESSSMNALSQSLANAVNASSAFDISLVSNEAAGNNTLDVVFFVDLDQDPTFIPEKVNGTTVTFKTNDDSTDTFVIDIDSEEQPEIDVVPPGVCNDKGTCYILDQMAGGRVAVFFFFLLSLAWCLSATHYVVPSIFHQQQQQQQPTTNINGEYKY